MDLKCELISTLTRHLPNTRITFLILVEVAATYTAPLDCYHGFVFFGFWLRYVDDTNVGPTKELCRFHDKEVAGLYLVLEKSFREDVSRCRGNRNCIDRENIYCGNLTLYKQVSEAWNVYTISGCSALLRGELSLPLLPSINAGLPSVTVYE